MVEGAASSTHAPVVEELRRAGFAPQLSRVSGPDAFDRAVGEPGWDLILLAPDAELAPLEALAHLRRQDLDVPVIVVSPRLGEEVAVEAMQAGAHDYVFTDNLARLGPAVRRELQSAQARRERRQALAARREMVSRSAFLAEASRRLAASLNLEETLAAAARVAVPEAADWCLITLRAGEEGDARTVLAHRDADLEALAATRLAAGPRPSAPPAAGAGEVMASGQRSWLGPDSVLAGALCQPEGGRLTRQLGFDAGLCVPLRATDRVLGAITLVWASPGRRFGLDDTGLVEELASRVALAIESALHYRQAREAIRARDEFLSIAAHELNTPLATLALLVEGLAEEELPVRERNAGLARARRQVKRLGRLVANLLDVSRLLAHRLDVELVDIDLVSVLREVLEQLEPELSRARCALELDAPERLPGRWDPVRLSQVFTNLLSNACKYGAGQPITVTLRLVEGRAWVAVRDRGIGIPENELEQIFELFGRTSSARPFAGLGLGLYVSRKVVEAHGGRIQARTPDGPGALLEVQLPIHPVRRSAEGAAVS